MTIEAISNNWRTVVEGLLKRDFSMYAGSFAFISKKYRSVFQPVADFICFKVFLFWIYGFKI
ncbi:hypothetical protein, partial [Parapedobacter sp. SGR-10]|uniref:hypothetical protein n=1 Tax=Parapedobacter sp. SGR-10 TaxID=2710879 RepID=UPI00197FF2CC